MRWRSQQLFHSSKPLPLPARAGQASIALRHASSDTASSYTKTWAKEPRSTSPATGPSASASSNCHRSRRARRRPISMPLPFVPTVFARCELGLSLLRTNFGICSEPVAPLRVFSSFRSASPAPQELLKGVFQASLSLSFSTSSACWACTSGGSSSWITVQSRCARERPSPPVPFPILPPLVAERRSKAGRGGQPWSFAGAGGGPRVAAPSPLMMQATLFHGGGTTRMDRITAIMLGFHRKVEH